MRRGWVLSGVIGLAALGGVSAAMVAVASGASHDSVATTASNKQRAVSDAKWLLSGVVPPPGAVLQSGGTGIGPRAHLLTAALDSAVAHSTWTAPEDPASVLAFVQAHLPPGSSVFSTGSSGPSPSAQSVIRAWAPVPGVLDVRWLEISVGGASGGGTKLYAESQSQWLVVRPPRERVPAGVREVDLWRRRSGKRPMLIRRVTRRDQVRALITLIDALGLVQPVVINCPAELSTTPTVAVEFRRGAAGPVLARASVSANATGTWPDTLAGWACALAAGSPAV